MDYRGLRILAIDEIAIWHRHKYLTAVLDYKTEQVVWMDAGRSEKILNSGSGFQSRD
ncbi:MAG: hypothetical protein ABIK93_00405 [candidate division WOR-3 bacterium]